MSKLRECPTCGHNVSVLANQCPDCNDPLRPKMALKDKAFFFVFFLFCLFLIFNYWADLPTFINTAIDFLATPKEKL